MAKPLELTIHIDGAARGNPGPAAFAYVMYHDGEPLLEEKGRLGAATNNVAEYTALVKALEKAAELQATSILIRSDSELLVRQMNGEYRVKNAKLRPLYEEANRLGRRFESVRFSHVPREQNREADRLCNEALNEAAYEQRSSPARSSPREATRRTASRSANAQWEKALAEAERLLQEAAKTWAEKGLESPPPRTVLDRIVSVLESRGFIRRDATSS